MGDGLFPRGSVDTGGLVTFYVLFLIKLDTREVHIASITSTPNEQWMQQMSRNLTMEEWGILKPGQYLIHDGDKNSVPHSKTCSITPVSSGSPTAQVALVACVC